MKRKLIYILGIILFLLAVSVVSEPIDTTGYSISDDFLVSIVKLGDFEDVSFVINNKDESPLTVAITPTGSIADFVRIRDSTITVDPQQSSVFEFTLLGESLGFFNGTLELGGELAETIAINFTVNSLVASPVEALLLDIQTLDRNVFIGDDFRYQIDLQNLLIENSYLVNLYYTIDWIGSPEGATGTKLQFTDSENITLNTTSSLIKDFNVPEFIRPGEYELNVRAEFLGLQSTASERFFIGEKFLDYVILGILPVRWLLFFLIFVFLGLIGFLIYKKRKSKNKRYASEIKFKLLPKPGERSAFIGMIAETKVKAYYEVDNLSTHTLIAGSTGGGKTVSAEVLVEEALLKGASVMVFDPTAQWSGFLRRCQEKRMLELYKQYGMKPEMARAFNGNVKQILNAREIIDVKRYIKPGEINVFACNRLDPKEMDILVATTLKNVFDANLPEARQLRLLIIFDEVHRLLPKFGGSGQGFLQIERSCREFRKWGVGLFLISQVLTDFIGSTKANINTEIQMRTRDQGDLDRIKTKYGAFMLQSLLKAATGTGMLENPNYNNGNPYFVHFRPLLHEHARLNDEELNNYNKYNKEVDDIEYQIDELGKLDVDVFDMKLELKMALDKVKQGNFNMVKIYLEGLVPRIEKEFKARGKPMPIRKIKLLSEEVLREEFEKAKSAREAAGGGKIEVVKPANPELTLQNGVIIGNILELSDTIEADTKIFDQEVTKDKNNIADWIGKFKADAVDKVKAATTAADLVKVLREIGETKNEGGEEGEDGEGGEKAEA